MTIRRTGIAMVLTAMAIIIGQNSRALNLHRWARPIAMVAAASALTFPLRQNRHQKYALARIPTATPASVPTMLACAKMFGHKAYSAAETVAPALPYSSADQ